VNRKVGDDGVERRIRKGHLPHVACVDLDSIRHAFELRIS
jgi:hypothetical protein